MDRKAETPDIAALLAEIERLRATIAVSGNNAGAGGPVRLLARVVYGVDAMENERLVASLREDGWFSLALSDEDYPGISTLCALADSLPGDSCGLTGALRPAPFKRRLLDEMSRAMRHNSDLALIILAGASVLDEEGLIILAESARDEMGGGETLARLDDQHLAIISPGARQLKARALAERILDHFTAALPVTSLSSYSCTAAKAGIVCFSPDGSHVELVKISEKLREQALTALENAPPNQARLFQRDTRPMAEKSVLVQAGEKQFLFFGSMEQS